MMASNLPSATGLPVLTSNFRFDIPLPEFAAWVAKAIRATS